MSDEKDGKSEGGAPGPGEEERTVFMPAGTPPTPAAPADQPPADPPPAPAAEPTVVRPSEEAAPAATDPGSNVTATPAGTARAIKVGDVLNHIFEVKRFLARGGMGEVFEGCNVNTDERVAIKVMLPALAADEKVVAMFRKEARTLTKLQHEALVQYRVLAQEPQLGALYIVTEFIQGVSLCDMLGKVERSPEELAGLLRRLASGLSAAHRLGAIHRDISPDNVLLPDSDVHQAKIIDFGIAKDLDASSATIVGDGFAGKLNYVAPEQLGDFGREVGPWTDVYSLGLVILAVAQGKNVNMSGSLVDAIDKRRKGPDLSAVPASLRGLLEDMTRPDPKDRLRSMDDVIARLGGAAPRQPEERPQTEQPEQAPRPGTPKIVFVIVAVAIALALAAAAWFFLGRANPIGPGGDPTARARSAINTVLPSVSCTWLDIATIENRADGLAVAMRGVAGDSQAAQGEIVRALEGAGIANPRIDFGDVAPITPAGCAALDTYRQTRASSNYHLSATQPRFEMALQPPGLPYAGGQASNAVIDFDFSNASGDFAILGIEPSGTITALIPNRAAFDSALQQSADGRPITDLGNGRYRLNIDLDHAGWSGIILVSGQGPFDPDTVAPPIGSRGPSWQQSFLAQAAEKNWRVEMAWFESVDRVQGDTAQLTAAAPAPPAAAEDSDKP